MSKYKIIIVQKFSCLLAELESQISWGHPWYGASHTDQVRWRASQWLGVLNPLLNRHSSLSIRNGLTLYKQLIRPMMDYTCPVWRHAANSHIRRLQVLQSAYNSGRTLVRQKFATVPYLAEHIRNLAQSFFSKIPDLENLLIRQLGRYLSYPRDE